MSTTTAPPAGKYLAVAGQVSRRASQQPGNHASHVDPPGPASLTLMDLGGKQIDTTQVDSSGAYALRAPTAGTYLVVCSAQNCQPSVKTVTLQGESQHLDIDLDDILVLTGTVRLARDGRGLADILVVLVDAEGDVSTTTTTSGSGEYQLVAPSPGTYTVAVSAAGFHPLAVEVELADEVSMRDLELSRSGWIAGVVRGATGRRVANARVVLVHTDGSVVASTLTGVDGDYTFDNLEANDYTIVASSHVLAATAVSVREQPVEQDIRFASTPDH